MQLQTCIPFEDKKKHHFVSAMRIIKSSLKPNSVVTHVRFVCIPKGPIKRDDRVTMAIKKENTTPAFLWMNSGQVRSRAYTNYRLFWLVSVPPTVCDWDGISVGISIVLNFDKINNAICFQTTKSNTKMCDVHTWRWCWMAMQNDSVVINGNSRPAPVWPT